MNLNDLTREEDVVVQEFDYGDETVYAVDLGTGPGTVDVVGNTAIVVVGDTEYDVELPEGDAQAFIRNGVLTIEVSHS